MVNHDLITFTSAYVEALLWSTSSETEEGETVNLDNYVPDSSLLDRCQADCRAFFFANEADIRAAAEQYGNLHAAIGDDHDGIACVGHDFALTRNHHGAGFWDGDLEMQLGARLTEASDAAGEHEIYLGDDGLVYSC